jgi:hypothetical protein
MAYIMAIKTFDDMFECSICHTKYSNAIRADACRDNHDTVYIPLSKAELNGLRMLIQLGDTSVITVALIEKLDKYAREANRARL